MSKATPSPKQLETTPVKKLRPAPLRLKELIFPRIHVKALVPKGEAANSFMPYLDDASLDFRFELSADGTEASAGMRIRSKDTSEEPENNAAYMIDVEAFAAFTVEGPEHRHPMADYLRKFAAAAALLGGIREQVAISTARGPWGVFTIPIVSMDLIVGPPPSTVQDTPSPDMPAKKRVSRKPKTTKSE